MEWLGLRPVLLPGKLGWDMALGRGWEDLGLSGKQQGVPDCIRQVVTDRLRVADSLLLMWL